MPLHCMRTTLRERKFLARQDDIITFDAFRSPSFAGRRRRLLPLGYWRDIKTKLPVL